MKLHTDGTVEGTPEELASYAYHKDILDRLVYGDNPEAKKDSIWGKGYFEPGDIIPMTKQEAARIRNGEDINEMLRKRKDQVDIQLNK